MPAIRSYRDLIVWQRSVDLIVSVYDLTSQFPSDERFGLTSQVRRASVSIAANIAEGSGRDTRSDLLRFLSMARGSIREVETLLIVGERLQFTTASKTAVARNNLEEVGKMLTGLRASLRSKL
jgi:four helix bundle protein